MTRTALTGRAVLAALVVVAGACQTAQEKKDGPVATAAEGAQEREPPTEAARLFERGVAHLKGDSADVERAADAFKQAVETDPAFGVGHYNLAVLREKAGDTAEAARLYRAAFDADPKLDVAVENLGRLLEAKGDEDAARDLYREAIDKHAEAVGPRIRLARLARRDGDAKTAAQLAREALEFDGQSIDAYRLLARLYAENKKNQLARLIAIRGQKLAPDDAELTFSLALVAQNERNVAVARELLQKVIAKDATHDEARVVLAEMAMKTRDWKTATTQLEALLAAGGDNPSLHVNLGLALKGQGRFDDARQAYERALAVNDSYPPALLNLGVLELRHLDQPAKAEEHLARYLSQAEDTKAVENLLAEARVLIEAKAEEARQLELIAQQEAEAQRLAEEEAARAAAAGGGEGGEGAAPESPPEGAEPVAEGEQVSQADTPPAVEEPPPPPPEVVKEEPKPKPKRKRKRKPRAKPRAPERAPEQDDDFFND